MNDVRHTAFGLRIDSADWVDFVSDLYRDFSGCIVDQNDKEILLDLEVFEVPSNREWFRDWANSPLPEGKVPRLRAESRERIRVLATILRAHFRDAAMLWDGVRPANDNNPDEETEKEK